MQLEQPTCVWLAAHSFRGVDNSPMEIRLTLAAQLSSFRIVPMPRVLVSSELLLLLSSSR